MTSREVLRVLGSKYSAQILEATDEPRTAQELSEELGIPIATCYRRIGELTDHGLLELHDDVLSDDERRTKVYRRTVDRVCAEFDHGLAVSVDRRAEVTDKIDRIWGQTEDVAG